MCDFLLGVPRSMLIISDEVLPWLVMPGVYHCIIFVHYPLSRPAVQVCLGVQIQEYNVLHFSWWLACVLLDRYCVMSCSFIDLCNVQVYTVKSGRRDLSIRCRLQYSNQSVFKLIMYLINFQDLKIVENYPKEL